VDLTFPHLRLDDRHEFLVNGQDILIREAGIEVMDFLNSKEEMSRP